MNNFANHKLLFLRRWPIRFALLIVVAAGLAKWQASWMPTDVSVPPQALPPPSLNARDYFNAAAKLIQGPVEYAEYSTPGGTLEQRANPTSGYHVITAAEKDRIVTENLPAFQKLEEGLKYQYVEQPYHSILGAYPSVAYRKIAFALHVAGSDRAAHRDWNGASSYYIDCMEMGVDVTHGSDLMGSTVGSGFESIGRTDGASSVVEHLNAEQAESAARRIAALDSGRPQLYEAIVQQKISDQAVLLQYFQKPNWRQALLHDSNAIRSNEIGYFGCLNRLLYEKPVDLSRYDIVDSIPQSLESPRTVYGNYSTQMDRAALRAKHGAHDWDLPTDIFDLELLPDLDIADSDYSYNAAMDRLLETRLALRAYRLRNGRYPANLNELVPSYLPQVPIDPFSDNQLLKYRADGNMYLLYSIGPDRVDDGGKPVYNPQISGNKYTAWTPSEKGDIVAGINEN